jgi:hypothetical protein
MGAVRSRSRTSQSLTYFVITALMILTVCCCLLAGVAAGGEATVEVSARIAPTIQVTNGGTVRSNSTVKSQVVDGILTIMPL